MWLLGTAFWVVVALGAWFAGAVIFAVVVCGWRNALSLFVPGIASNADDPQHDRPVPPSCEKEGEGEWTSR